MENRKGEKVKRGNGEMENRETLSERFALFLHLPFSPFTLFAHPEKGRRRLSLSTPQHDVAFL
jgi:hypothetical protein